MSMWYPFAPQEGVKRLLQTDLIFDLIHKIMSPILDWVQSQSFYLYICSLIESKCCTDKFH